ncbi:MAG TPA: cytochrome c-type biogenesis protein [Aquabacterium sp.]|uniref:cytochrome c-type biogenesis protein n=1 Tax=Aquabacterium sp. TaxID=1872578 RepID=UPI002E2FACC1|nr:cytochrome c-type biogenesis protein [Aquabacterium sp.]HEX5374278.1 cytochrome c-type biogenesis protein [Aquabacterium sp.]
MSAHWMMSGMGVWRACMRTLIVSMVLWSGMQGVLAGEAAPLAADPALEARMMAIASELRCLVCQNQTVADSHSGLATDLRQEIRGLLQQGQTDQQVRDYMTARYGDFILYRPPVNASTALLWFGPALLAVVGLLVLWRVLRQRARMNPQDFEPDQPESADIG